jgi:hypothetical protein
MLALVAVYLGGIAFLVIGVTVGKGSWRWPVAVMAAVGLGLTSIMLFSDGGDGPAAGFGLAAIMQLTVCFAVFAAVYGAGLFWWFRRR